MIVIVSFPEKAPQAAMKRLKIDRQYEIVQKNLHIGALFFIKRYRQNGTGLQAAGCRLPGYYVQAPQSFSVSYISCENLA
jgi:hypothetical protein